MSAIKVIEKGFSFLGATCQVIGATIILAVLGHYLLGAAGFLYNYALTGEREKVDARFASPVYDDYPWRIEYWREFETAWGSHFEPYYHWRHDPVTGRYINVDGDGIRRTVKDLDDGERGEASRVFMFGGSTMWGTGAPDDQTIPSIFQRIGEGEYDVYNFGDSAYVSTQELNYLLYQLSAGNVPDIVIFYDGVNDGYAGAYSPAIPRDPHNLRLERAREGTLAKLATDLFEDSHYSRFADFAMRVVNRLGEGGGEGTGGPGSAWDADIAPDIAANSQGVVDMYEAHIKQIKALGREYGFATFFFWQPNLFSLTRRAPNEYEKDMIASASPVLVESQRQVYEAAKRQFSGRESENIHFLGNVFDDVDEPIYIDWHHLGPNGNEIIARQMLRAVRGMASSSTTAAPGGRG